MSWEYCTHTAILHARLFDASQFDQRELTRVLNDLGDQNWELVSSFTTAPQRATRQLTLIFKRPKPPPLPSSEA